MIKSITMEELTAVQNRYRQLTKEIKELETVLAQIDQFFDDVDLGKILIRQEAA